MLQLWTELTEAVTRAAAEKDNNHIYMEITVRI